MKSTETSILRLLINRNSSQKNERRHYSIVLMDTNLHNIKHIIMIKFK